AVEVIRKRRGWQDRKGSYPEFILWAATEPLPSFEAQTEHRGLHGQGVSAGSAEGMALVLDNPSDALETFPEDYILVTKNTDPAWVFIMSRSKGLVSEKGSLLSHTAIIGRELSIPT